MKLTAQEIAQWFNGKVEGKPDVVFTHVAELEKAEKGALSFLSNARYEAFIYTTQASGVLVANDFHPKKKLNTTLIRVKDVYLAFTTILQKHSPASHLAEGIASESFIHKTAQLDPSVRVGAFSTIMEEASIEKNTRIYPPVFIGARVRIGQNVTLYPGVKIYHNCEIGDNTIIHANAVIGSDGFGFAPGPNGVYEKIPQTGKVIIESDVEIGANTVIDRATLGATLIKKGTKLDNLIQVAHNVVIGANTVIAAQTGIAGSTQIGNRCQIGGQAGFVGHIQVADEVKVQAQSGVTSSIPEKGKRVYGYPALSYSTYLKAYALFRKLPELEKRISLLERKEKQ